MSKTCKLSNRGLALFYSLKNRFEIGIDEAGRGPMFGRVYAAAVVFTDAATLVDDATTKSFWLARGMPELAWSATTACDAAPDPEGV